MIKRQFTDEETDFVNTIADAISTLLMGVFEAGNPLHIAVCVVIASQCCSDPELFAFYKTHRNFHRAFSAMLADNLQVDRE